ncbi:MAG: hypothetical protein M0Q94_02630 [Candidatus Cloacimonetes bacterium]|nr:hypothetical protein [Candidatus Cloacimonadota bacterium]
MAEGDFYLSELLQGSKKIYVKNTANETNVITMQNGAVAIGNGISLDVSGMGTAICQVSGTFVGIITFEASLDNVIFNSIDAQDINGGLISPSVTSAGFYKIPCGGVKYIRARISAYTSGSITVNGYAEALSCNNNTVQLSGSKVEIGGVTFEVSGGDTIRGKSADKPAATDAHALIPYCFYFAVDTGVVEVTDGTNWVVI